MTMPVPFSGCGAGGPSTWRPATTRSHSMKLIAAFNGTLQGLFDQILARKRLECGTLVEMKFIVEAGILTFDVGTYGYDVTAAMGEYVIRAEGYEIDMTQLIKIAPDVVTPPVVHVHARFISNSETLPP